MAILGILSAVASIRPALAHSAPANFSMKVKELGIPGAALVIVEVEAGRIKLDEPVRTYLSWFRVADVIRNLARKRITRYSFQW